MKGLFLLGVVLLACGLLLFFFKADWLIAGYNTMPEEEKRRRGLEPSRIRRMGGLGLTGIGLLLVVLSFFIKP